MSVAVGESRPSVGIAGRTIDWPSDLPAVDLTERAAQGALMLACLTFPWNAIQVHGVPIGDLPLFLSLALFAFNALRRRVVMPPATMMVGTALITASGLASSLFAVSPTYLAARFRIAATAGTTSLLAPRSTSNLLSLVKFESSILVLPLVIAAAAHGRIAPLRRYLAAWVAGIGASSAVATSDRVGATHISANLLGYAQALDRQSGLTIQPTNVGLQAVIALPLLMWFFLDGSRRTRLACGAGFAVALGGIYSSGSRGALGGIGLAVALTLILVRESRRWVGILSLGAAAAAVGVVLTSAGDRLVAAFRLGKSASAAASDTQRAQLLHQGLRDIRQAPIHGIGFGYANDAHDIFVQITAAGGVLALLGFLLFCVSGVLIGVRDRRSEGLAAACAASVLAWLVTAAVENQLSDQYLYVPLACLAAVGWARTDDDDHRRSAQTAGGDMDDYGRDDDLAPRAQDSGLPKGRAWTSATS